MITRMRRAPPNHRVPRERQRTDHRGKRSSRWSWSGGALLTDHIQKSSARQATIRSHRDQRLRAAEAACDLRQGEDKVDDYASRNKVTAFLRPANARIYRYLLDRSD